MTPLESGRRGILPWPATPAITANARKCGGENPPPAEALRGHHGSGGVRAAAEAGTRVAPRSHRANEKRLQAFDKE